MDANFFTSNNPASPLGRRQAPALDGLAHGLQALSLGGSSPAAYHPPDDGNLGFLETTPPPPPLMSYGYEVNLFGPRTPFLDPKPDFSRQRTSLVDHNKSYRFQKYLERCSYKEIATIVFALTRNQYTLVHMAKNEDRVNFVNKLIEVAKISPVLLNRITSALGISGAYQLMVDLNGFKLILHCLNNLRAEDNLFIYATAVKFCSQIAKTVKGMVCLKECISKSSTQHRNLIVKEVVENSVSLATDPHGNFIVQFVIDLRHAIVNKCICACVAEHLEHISTNKNGSYVVEKCLKSEGGELLLEAFVRLGIDKLEGLAMHPQGNYVLQCAIRLDKKSKFRDELVQAIRQLPDHLSCDQYAKNVLNLVRASRRGNVQRRSM